MNEQPIGVFDSGIGGLAVLREVRAQLPHEDTLYLADQQRFPYGNRPPHELQKFAREATHFLLARSAKVIVVACNSASAVALDTLRAEFAPVPFIGMEPAIKPAAGASRSRVVGVLATAATLNAPRFDRLVKQFAADAQIIPLIEPALVELVEDGDAARADSILAALLAPAAARNMDTLVLGCSHYSFLKAALSRHAGPEVQIVDPAQAVARQVERVLDEHALRGAARAAGRAALHTTGDPSIFRMRVEQLLGPGHDVRLDESGGAQAAG